MQTRNNEGEGYALFKIEESVGQWVLGPGAVIVEDGTWLVGGAALVPGEAAVLNGPSLIAGLGMIGVVTTGASVVGAQYAPPTRAEVMRHDKPWGYELEVVITGELAEKIQLKRLRVDDGECTSEQYHNHKDEVMGLFGGDGFVDAAEDIDDEGYVHIAPGVLHRVWGPRDYFEASTYHPTDVVRTADAYGRAVDEVKEQDEA